MAHVAWDDSDPTGQSYIDALEAALYPAANPLSAVFTQGSEKFYTFDNSNSLKEHLVVTYTDEHGQISEVTSYTLSGSLTVGMSRIAVSYEGETAYFFVNVETISIDNNYAIEQNNNYATKAINQIAARCRFAQPIKNRSYTIAVVDSAKYAIAGFNLINNVLTEIEIETAGSTTTIWGYELSNSEKVSFVQSVTATGNYIWCSFKKNDGTDFTASEIANAYGTIYTVS